MVVGDLPTGTDVAVIGAGPGGYVAAIRAGQFGLDVTLIEKDAWGGTCLNYGCIPSKALLSATGLAREAATAEELGIDAEIDVDYGSMVGWKDSVVDRITSNVEQLCAASGATLVEGSATFVDDRTLRVAGENRSETLEFEHAIVATGSRPIELPGFSFEDERVLDSRRALALDSVPERLVVVGASYVGLELSTVFARLGTDVTVIEVLPGPLPGYEPDVTRIVRERLEALGVEFRFEQRVEAWENDGGVVVAASEAGDRVEYDADYVLVAVGRRPVTETVNPAAAGLDPDERGFLPTDDQARTEQDSVFAAGDVAGGPMLAHKAMREGRVAAEVIAGEPSGLDYQALPAVVFTEPEVATVGLTASQAEEQGYTPVVGRFPFGANGRALSAGESDGFVRVVADGAAGFLLGAQVVGPSASELIAELALAVEMGATLEDIAGTIHTHPTFSEAVMEAAEEALDRPIHVRPGRRDESGDEGE